MKTENSHDDDDDNGGIWNYWKLTKQVVFAKAITKAIPAAQIIYI